MSIKDKYKVISINPSLCKEWLLYKHYAHRVPIIIYSFGIYDRENTLNGVCVFSYPCRMLMESTGYYLLELTRLVINENLEKNLLSYFVKSCLDLLPKPMQVVSYADSNQGHHGYIYQATNWIYTGLSSKEKKVFVNGKLQHRRTLNSLYGTSSPKELSKKTGINIEVEEQDGKYRYFYFLGDKRQVREMKSSLKYPVLPYPKGDNKRYDASYQTTNQETLFL
ncbi:hypothetical protein [Flavobacterium filum]|uniref:Mom family adenine methylcarbamoylation protein n=1 Tax=Flavobacterium filum TaxID=370974 RepID=UPI0023F5943D|nr:hypothetical protein [Flavobacterium filum]